LKLLRECREYSRFGEPKEGHFSPIPGSFQADPDTGAPTKKRNGVAQATSREASNDRGGEGNR
jgi:hypothetical protein